MNILLDTHVVLWVAENSPKLSEKARTLLPQKNYKKYVSIASAWEIAIKLGRADFRLDGGLNEFFRIISRNDYLLLPVKGKYLHRIPDLPKLHKDPFDRLLVATAITEEMALLTIDENIHRYDVNSVW